MKKLLAVILAMTLTLSLAACGSKETTNEATNKTDVTPAETSTDKVTETVTSAPATDPNGTHIVTDHAGNQVEVPNTVNRIVVADIYPMASVLTVFFDSGEKIVGMAAPCMSAAKNGLLGEMYPEILNAKTDFIDGTNINIEELLKLNPDVVFYSAGSKEEGELLRNAGIPAIAISPGKWGYNAIETLNQWIDTLVQIFPENNKSQIVREYSEKTYKLVQERVAGLKAEDKVKAFFLFQYSDSNIMTSGQKFFGQWWCDAIGAVNAANELENDTAQPEDLYNNTVGNYDWSEIDAIKNKEVYKMPLGMYRSYTCGVDTPVTLLWLAKTAYPSLFEDIDITAETKKYYQEVFGITLTDEQANKIFSPVTAAGTGFVGNGK